MLAGDFSAQRWITTRLQDELPAQDYRRAVLMRGAKSSIQVLSLDKQVCACFNLTDVAMGAHSNQCQSSAIEQLNSLLSALKCGTHFGSCVPELQRRVRDNETTAAAAVGSAN